MKQLPNTLKFSIAAFLTLLLSLLAAKQILAKNSIPSTVKPSLLDTAELQPTIQQARTAEEILIKLQRRHYEKRQFNDSMSSSLLDSYLEKLDPAKTYFSAADIAAFDQYRFQLDDGIRRGNLAPSFIIFNDYRQRVTAHLQSLLENLPERINALDFTKQESIPTDPGKLSWADSPASLAERKRKNFKNTVLGLRIDKRIEEDITSALDSIPASTYAKKLSKCSRRHIGNTLREVAAEVLDDGMSDTMAGAFSAELEKASARKLFGYWNQTIKSNNCEMPDTSTSEVANSETAPTESTPEHYTALVDSIKMHYITASLSSRYSDQLDRIEQLNTDDVFQLYINALSELYDPHTNYLSPKITENFSIQMRLSLEGIGALLKRDGEHTVVERLIPAGPAEKQGELQPGDKIIGVGQNKSDDIVNVIGWRLDEVVELIRGKKKSLVRLKVIPADAAGTSSVKVISIVRNTVKLEEQSAKKDSIEILRNDKLFKLGVITIPTFYSDFEGSHRGDKNYKSTTRDVARLVDELRDEKVDGFIIDLRGNGGGSLQEVNQLLGLFIERGPVVQIRYSNGRIVPESNYPNPDFIREPVAVLIDRLSASASEIFAGAIQDYERGVIIGSQSFGKGTVQQLADLSYGSLKLTQAKFYRISGESTQHRGVIPDVQIPSLYDSQEIGENTLDNALGWDRVEGLRHRKYGNISKQKDILNQRHKARVANDPDFNYLLDKIELGEKYISVQSLSLNEIERSNFIDQDQRERKAIEEDYKRAKGLPIESANDEEPGTANHLAGIESSSDKIEKKTDPRTQFLLMEAGHILLDSMQLSDSREATAKPLAANRNR